MSILNDISQKRSYQFRDAPGIATDATTSKRGEEGAANQDVKLSPESIAKVGSYNTPPFRRRPYHALHSRISTLLIRTALPGPGSSIVSLHCQYFCSAGD